MQSDREQAAAELIAGLTEQEVDQFGQILTSVADRLRRLVEAATDETGEKT
jgi:hypothetical protein